MGCRVGAENRPHPEASGSWSQEGDPPIPVCLGQGLSMPKPEMRGKPGQAGDPSHAPSPGVTQSVRSRTDALQCCRASWLWPHCGPWLRGTLGALPDGFPLRTCGTVAQGFSHIRKQQRGSPPAWQIIWGHGERERARWGPPPDGRAHSGVLSPAGGRHVCCGTVYLLCFQAFLTEARVWATYSLWSAPRRLCRLVQCAEGFHATHKLIGWRFSVSYLWSRESTKPPDPGVFA